MRNYPTYKAVTLSALNQQNFSVKLLILPYPSFFTGVLGAQ